MEPLNTALLSDSARVPERSAQRCNDSTASEPVPKVSTPKRLCESSATSSKSLWSTAPAAVSASSWMRADSRTPNAGPGVTPRSATSWRRTSRSPSPIRITARTLWQLTVQVHIAIR